MGAGGADPRVSLDSHKNEVRPVDFKEFNRNTEVRPLGADGFNKKTEVKPLDCIGFNKKDRKCGPWIP